MPPCVYVGALRITLGSPGRRGTLAAQLLYRGSADASRTEGIADGPNMLRRRPVNAAGRHRHHVEVRRPGWQIANAALGFARRVRLWKWCRVRPGRGRHVATESLGGELPSGRDAALRLLGNP